MTKAPDKSRKNDLFHRIIDFVFGFENKKGEVLGYWISCADGLNFSSQEFYDAVEQQLAARKFPSMEISRQEFAAGGLLSNQRTYLRLFRERLAIITCAAPFGKVFFFSCRTVYVPALVRLWHLVVALLLFGILFQLLVAPLGFFYALIAVIALVFASAATLRNVAASALSDLDALLLKIPVISTIYEDWFREDTFYRLDTRHLYMNLLPELIRELAQEACAAKGVKLEARTPLELPAINLREPRPEDLTGPVA